MDNKFLESLVEL